MSEKVVKRDVQYVQQQQSTYVQTLAPSGQLCAGGQLRSDEQSDRLEDAQYRLWRLSEPRERSELSRVEMTDHLTQIDQQQPIKQNIYTCVGVR